MGPLMTVGYKRSLTQDGVCVCLFRLVCLCDQLSLVSRASITLSFLISVQTPVSADLWGINPEDETERLTRAFFKEWRKEEAKVE